jgi:hypothetical protein
MNTGHDRDSGMLSAVEELAVYCGKRFDAEMEMVFEQFPLEDEPHVATWERYAAEAGNNGVYETLSRHLVQFAFPIRAGIRESESYRAVTLRGADRRLFPDATGLRLRHPEAMALFLQQTAVGRIPVLLVPDREDFVDVVRALSRRNEPVPIPASMGACTIQGYNNWQRISEYRSRWEEAYPESEWNDEFIAFREMRELYQDCFIVLSKGAYSGVEGRDIGMDDDAWIERSHLIRLHHECAHYVTRRLFGSMRNHLLDELLADYAGIVAAFGAYSSDLFLRFIGLEDFPFYRSGGRMENYLGDPPLSAHAFVMLQKVVVTASANLNRADRENRGIVFDASEQLMPLVALSRMSLMELTDPAMPKMFRSHLLNLGQQ